MATLRRELDLYDLSLLLIVAVVNVNILPAIAVEGWRSILVWLLAFVFFSSRLRLQSHTLADAIRVKEEFTSGQE